MDHAKYVLAGIIPNRRDNLLYAETHLTPEHFRQESERNIFILLGRYEDIAAGVLPRSTLSDMMRRQDGVDVAKRVFYEELFAKLEVMQVSDSDFRYSVDALKELRSEQLTGEAITKAYEIVDRGAEIDGEIVKGHTEARSFLYQQLAHIDHLGSADVAPEGDIRHEMEEFWKEYATKAANPETTGIYTGIRAIDTVTAGYQPGELIIVCGYTGTGKAAPLHTKIFTPDGWTTMGEVSVGDRVLGADGQPQKVVAVHERGEQETYRVRFSDGSSTEVAGDHLWSVQDNNDRHGRTLTGSRVFSTEELKKRLPHNRYFVPLVGPVEFESPLARPIHPYVLGVLLGDAHINSKGQVWLTSFDEQIVDEVTALLPPTDDFRGTSRKGTYILTGRFKVLPGWLREMGVAGCRSWEKFVPPEYLFASREDRLSLLQGLMDTDGSSGLDVEFGTTSSALRDAVVFLVQSLGGTATIGTRPAREKARQSYRVRVKLPKPLNPFRLRRKVDKVPEATGRRAPFRRIRSIEPLGRQLVRCITVSNDDGLYVTDDFLVTHNSQFCAQTAWQAAVVQGKNVFLATTETIRPTVRRRIIARHSRLPQFEVPGGFNTKHIKEATLSVSDQEKLREVTDDLRLNPAYGKLYIAQVPRGATLAFLEGRLARQQASWNIDLVIMDYLALLKPDRKRDSKVNEMSDLLIEAKQIAATFDNGRGIPFVSPWAMQQNAFRDARQKGEYTLASLSDTSEAEKSADQIMSFLQLDAPNEVKVQFLKNRDGEKPQPFTLEADFRCAFLGEKRTANVGGLLTVEGLG